MNSNPNELRIPDSAAAFLIRCSFGQVSQKVLSLKHFRFIGDG